MKAAIEESIQQLAELAGQKHNNALAALQYSQAALNLAQTLCALSASKK